MPSSATGIGSWGIVHLIRNMSSNINPANPAVIIVACEFFRASKDADMAIVLFIQN
jgi:hypothetical protein